ncbi:succinyl-diaminopimelate desuccinylase [Candidatus Marinamargulisbacteria bacterium SCGC AG-343-D04]|nr:succinyl-diaminopimelate desuccinylase [Candidatus Marinamargulisbacteria bacterium SCGC AG-343-D04]
MSRMNDKERLVATIQELLAIPSPTFHEQAICDFIVKRLQKTQPTQCIQDEHGIIAHYRSHKELPTLAFVGHTDVVPEFFEPRIDGSKLHGAGASDMKAGLGACLYIVEEHLSELLERFNIVFIVYNREEGTALKENGLYSLLKENETLLKMIDCAIVAEPTDNAIQLGCMGSLHVMVSIEGKESHSARPWNGDNALYKALPLLQYIAAQDPVVHSIDELTFTEVMTVTECNVPEGRTTIPGTCDININYRFSPKRTEEEAYLVIEKKLRALKIEGLSLEIRDSVPSGQIIRSAISDEIMTKLGCNIEAKQAWTDVAQLSSCGIPCFNFGPGQQTQAHKDNEYVDIESIYDYYHHIMKLVL